MHDANGVESSVDDDFYSGETAMESDDGDAADYSGEYAPDPILKAENMAGKGDKPAKADKSAAVAKSSSECLL
ncbi:hypothetical protein Hanom_Chr14g01324381 [Helianthus anomalus]